MKFSLQVICTAIACFILQQFLPWWTIAIAAAACAYGFTNKPLVSFIAGFLGVALLWLGMAFIIDATSASVLTQKVNKILPLNAFLLTGIIGGLVGGLSAVTGVFFKQALKSLS